MHQNTQSTSQDNDDFDHDHLYDYDNMCGGNTTTFLQIIFSHCLIFRYNHHIFIYIFSTTMPSCHKSSGAKKEEDEADSAIFFVFWVFDLNVNYDNEDDNEDGQARRAGVV